MAIEGFQLRGICMNAIFEKYINNYTIGELNTPALTFIKAKQEEMVITIDGSTAPIADCIKEIRNGKSIGWRRM